MKMLTSVVLAGAAMGLAPAVATAQPVFVPKHIEEHSVKSGRHDGPPIGAESADPSAAQLVFSDVIQAAGAPWLRVHFGKYDLGQRSHLKLISLEDSAEQRLDTVSIENYRATSAKFNGDAVEIQLYAAPGETGIFADIDWLVVGEWVSESGMDGQDDTESLCGGDNRVASTDGPVGRINGCTAWLTSNGAALTAGHCTDFDPDRSGPLLPDGVLDLSGVIEFNVPASDPDGTTNAADPNDQYPIDTSDVTWRFDGEGQGLGKDWSVFGVLPNSNTNIRPHIARGFKRMTRESPALSNTIRITGYGVDNGTQNRTEQTSTGPYVGEFSSGSDIWHRYQVDTQGANSGSPIIWNSNGFTIGIHTNAGCQSDGTGSNSGTSFEVNALETALQSFPGSNTEYVDSISTHPATFENGTIFQPYDSMSEAVSAVLSGGRISVVEGNYPAASGNTFTAGADGKSFFIEAPVGTVTIGY